MQIQKPNIPELFIELNPGEDAFKLPFVETLLSDDVDGVVLGKICSATNTKDYYAVVPAPMKAELMKDPIPHYLVLGGEGSGKTKKFIIPYIYQAIKRGEALVILDEKGFIYRRIHNLLLMNDYEINVVDTASEASFKGSSIGEAKTATFLYFDSDIDYSGERSNPIKKTFLSALNEIADKRFDAEEDGKVSRPCHVIADEFLVMGKIKNININVMSYDVFNLHYVFSAKSISDIERVYPEGFFGEVLCFCGTVVEMGPEFEFFRIDTSQVDMSSLTAVTAQGCGEGGSLLLEKLDWSCFEQKAF